MRPSEQQGISLDCIPLTFKFQFRFFLLLLIKDNMEEELKNQEIALQVYPHQVSGKQPKLISQDRTNILKGLNLNQLTFYRKVFQQKPSKNCPLLQPFLPHFHGTLSLPATPRLIIQQERGNEWLTHLANRYSQRNESNSFILLQNLTQPFQQPCIFDIKIGGRNTEGKKHKITKSVSKLFIKLNGCKIADIDGKGTQMLLSKYFLASVVELQDITEYFAFFFAKGDHILKQTLTALSDKIRLILEVLQKFRGHRFISSSLCLLYDSSNPGLTDARIIDFGRVVEEDENFEDSDSLEGVNNILKILVSIAQNIERNEELLPKIRQRCLDSQVLHIPENKKWKPPSSPSL